MKKKSILLIIVLCLTLVACACGGSSNEAVNDKPSDAEKPMRDCNLSEDSLGNLHFMKPDVFIKKGSSGDDGSIVALYNTESSENPVKLIATVLKGQDFDAETFDSMKKQLFEMILSLSGVSEFSDYELKEFNIDGNATGVYGICKGASEGTEITIMQMLINEQDSGNMDAILLTQSEGSQYDYTDLFYKMLEGVSIS